MKNTERYLRFFNSLGMFVFISEIEHTVQSFYKSSLIRQKIAYIHGKMPKRFI